MEGDVGPRLDNEMGEGLFQKLKSFVILWLARLLPDCKRMTRRLGESLDRNPGWFDRIVMKLHLFTCEACARYLDQTIFLKKAMHEHGERAPAECDADTARRLSAGSKERMKHLLRSSAGPV